MTNLKTRKLLLPEQSRTRNLYQPQQTQVPSIQASNPRNFTFQKDDPKGAAAIKIQTEDYQYLISPFTIGNIPARKADEDMKVIQMDGRVEEKDKYISAKANEIFSAPGQSIETILKQLAKDRRTERKRSILERR